MTQQHYIEIAIGITMLVLFVWLILWIIYTTYRQFKTRKFILKTKKDQLEYALSLFEKIEKPNNQELLHIRYLKNKILLFKYFENNWFAPAGTLINTQFIPGLQQTVSSYFHKVLETSPILNAIKNKTSSCVNVKVSKSNNKGNKSK